MMDPGDRYSHRLRILLPTPKVVVHLLLHLCMHSIVVLAFLIPSAWQCNHPFLKYFFFLPFFISSFICAAHFYLLFITSIIQYPLPRYYAAPYSQGYHSFVRYRSLSFILWFFFLHAFISLFIDSFIHSLSLHSASYSRGDQLIIQSATHLFSIFK